MKTSGLNRNLKNKIQENAGMTLVELIVVFALVGIFMVAATFMLTASLRMFERMQGTSQAVTVSDLILDKISGEIAAAEIPEKEKSGYYFWLEKDTDASWTAFCNRSGSPVSMFAEGGELILKYYEMSSQSKKSDLNEINWRFDKNVYMNYKISHLGFSRPDATKHPNVVKIDLTLTNQRTGYEYQTTRFAENYNFDFDSDYMCVRNDGGTELPKQAIEFKIDESTNPGEPELIDYTVYYRDLADTNGTDLLPPKKDQVVEGTSVLEAAPVISGYLYNPEISENPKVIDATNNEMYLYYDKENTGVFTVYYICARTGKELKKIEYPDKKTGDTFSFTAQYISGYNLPVPEWVETTYTESNNKYIFKYQPILWPYTVIYRLRSSGEELKKSDMGQIYTDESIDVTSPKIVGYTPEKEEYTFTAIGDDAGGNNFTIYYTANQIPLTIRYQCDSLEIKEPTEVRKPYNTLEYYISAPNIEGYQKTLDSANVSFHISDSHFNAETESMEYIFYYTRKPANHPYTTVGPNVKVEVEPGEVPQELQKFGEAIADFFNSEWKKVGEDGYYKLYSDEDGKQCGIGGFENGNGSDNGNKLEEAIENSEKKEINGDFLFIKNGNGNTSTNGDKDDLLEHIAKAYGISGMYQELIEDADAIHFDFNGTHLAKVTFKIDNPKRDVTITFFE